LNRAKPFECPESVFWYLVGLIATDGCLSEDGRHVTITSAEAEYLSAIRAAAGLVARVSPSFKHGRISCYKIQITSVNLYRRLLALGLTPRKSLTLGPLLIPDSGFADFLRGVIDGDGCIRHWRHPSNGREQWALRIVSASGAFLEWLQPIVTRLWGVTGNIHRESRTTNDLFTLKYGKLAARVIFSECYYPRALTLQRKAVLAQKCVASVVGWSVSKTVPNASHWKGWIYQRDPSSSESEPPLVLERSAYADVV
jgi:hypothetical protein